MRKQQKRSLKTRRRRAISYRQKKRKSASRLRQHGGSQIAGANYISLDEFNAKFSANMVVLPTFLYAIGYSNGKIYIYDQNPEGETARYKHEIFPFWSEILPTLQKDPVYVVISAADGYSERLPTPQEPIEYYMADPEQFKGKEEISEKDPHKYPLLHAKKYVLTFSKRKADPYSIAIIDPFWLNGEIDRSLKEVHENLVPWEQKQNRCVWRGTTINGGPGSIREKFVSAAKEGKYPLVDYSDTQMTIPEMMRYKYQLDLDGWTNSWSAFVWKMASGSVVLKMDSPWEQIYYKYLKPGYHYIPVKGDLSDLNEKLEWCVNHDAECKTIAENAQKFVKEYLTVDRLKQETIAAIKPAL